MYRLEMSKNVELVTAIMWIYSVILKLVPSIALSILSTCLISKLTTTERRRQKLLKRSTVGPNEVSFVNSFINIILCKGKAENFSSRSLRYLLAPRKCKLLQTDAFHKIYAQVIICYKSETIAIRELIWDSVKNHLS